MSDQGSLFPPPGQPIARARRTDPAPSHEAARGTEASGNAASQRAACYAEVGRTPGQTAAEIASAIGLERHIPSRRLPELREAGLVENREVRTCRVGCRNSMTWYAKAGEENESDE